MKDTAPKELGILAVAALFGVVAWVVSYVVLSFGGFAAFVIGLVVALIVAIVLWLGWREPAPGPTGPRDLNPGAPGSGASAQSDSASASSPSTATAAAAPAAAATAATATAAAAAPAPAAPAAAKSSGGAKKSGGATKAAGGTAKSKSTAAKSTTAKSTSSKSAAAKPKATKSTATKSKAATAKSSAAPKAAAAGGGDAPEMLSGPRAGGADDLKLLKGVGPKLEGVLNGLGVYHFDQVASWGPSDIAWVDDRLKFKGRIERDGWVDQAKILAAGGETEFSKRGKK